MIELHRAGKDSRADEIAEKLTDLVVAHRVYVYEDEVQAGRPLPFIREGKKIIAGRANMDRFLMELESFRKIQNSFSADACYIDPETDEPC